VAPSTAARLNILGMVPPRVTCPGADHRPGGRSQPGLHPCSPRRPRPHPMRMTGGASTQVREKVGHGGARSPRGGQARLRHRAGQDRPPGRCSNSATRPTHRLQRPERKPDRGRPSQPPQQAPDDQVMLNLRANTAERSSRLAPLQQQRREQTKTAGIVKMHGTLPPPGTQSVRFVFGLQVPPPDLEHEVAAARHRRRQLRQRPGRHADRPLQGRVRAHDGPMRGLMTWSWSPATGCTGTTPTACTAPLGTCHRSSTRRPTTSRTVRSTTS
jgi:hypothetical protein